MAAATDVWEDLAADNVQPRMTKDKKFYLVGGKRMTRVTTFIDAIKDGYHLNAWKQRMVALGIADHRSLQLEVATCRDDKKALDDICRRAIDKAKGDEGSSIGTSLHDLTEAIDRGKTVTVPSPWSDDLDAYRQALAANKVEILPDWIEGFVVCRQFNVAGRFDRFVRIPGCEGLVAWDLKTGADCYFTEHAAQLALYANAEERWNPVDDTTMPMPADINKKVGIICHLPEGKATCTLHVVDIAAGWEAARTAHWVRKWWARRNDKSLAHPLDPASALATRREYLRRRAERLRDADENGLTLLAALWPSGVATFRESDAHGADELDAIERVLVDLEARYRLPLADGDPVVGLVALDVEMMIARLRALPPDLLAVVEAEAVGKVPHLRSANVRREHLDALEQLVGPAEAEAERRRAAVREAVAAVLADDTDEFLPVLAAYVTAGEREAHRLTESDVDALRRVCVELDAGRLVVGWDDDGAPLVRDAERDANPASGDGEAA